MTELHNMSVPPRSVLSVQRAEVRGRRYRVTRSTALCTWKGLDDAAVADCFQKDSVAFALALLDAHARPVAMDTFHEDVARYRLDPAAPAALRQTCELALSRLQLPDGFGFFVDEGAQQGDQELSVAEAIAVLAARSGPLYLPGRFEPSLIVPRDVTLFFPVSPADQPTTVDVPTVASTKSRGRRPSMKGAAR